MGKSGTLEIQENANALQVKPTIKTALLFLLVSRRITSVHHQYKQLLKWLTGTAPSILPTTERMLLDGLVEEIVLIRKIATTTDAYLMWEALCFLRDFVSKREQEALLLYIKSLPIEITNLTIE